MAYKQSFEQNCNTIFKYSDFNTIVLVKTAKPTRHFGIWQGLIQDLLDESPKVGHYVSQERWGRLVRTKIEGIFLSRWVGLGPVDQLLLVYLFNNVSLPGRMLD